MTKREEWGRWYCPECHVEEFDPVTILVTQCRNGHGVLLGAEVFRGQRSAWALSEDDVGQTGQRAELAEAGAAVIKSAGS